MGSVPSDGTIIALSEQTSLLLLIALLRPELESTLEREEVLVMLLMDMGQHAQRATGRRIGAHQGECMSRRRAGHGEAVQLTADRDGMRVGIVRNDIGARRRRRVLQIEVVKCGLRLHESSPEGRDEE